MICGRLFVHIGPPKTASTSLQCVLQELQNPKLLYLGIAQPRESREANIVSKLHHHVITAGGAYQYEVKKMLEDITENIARGVNVVISEEMFTVWQKGSPFWEKLERLDCIFRNLPLTYIITARDPLEALPSYYEEIYSSLSYRERRTEDVFFGHERCECFDYIKLANWVKSKGRLVRVIDFKKMTGTTLTIEDFIGEGGFECEFKIPKKNTGSAQRENPMLRALGPVTLDDILQSSRRARQISARLKKAPVFSGVCKRLLRIEVVVRSRQIPDGSFE